jgi:hypothetical protein
MTLELEKMLAENPQAVANALKLELSKLPNDQKIQILQVLPKELLTILSAKTAMQISQ